MDRTHSCVNNIGMTEMFKINCELKEILSLFEKRIDQEVRYGEWFSATGNNRNEGGKGSSPNFIITISATIFIEINEVQPLFESQFLIQPPLNSSCCDPGRRKQINWNFYFHNYLWCLSHYREVWKKIKLIFSLRLGLGRGELIRKNVC